MVNFIDQLKSITMLVEDLFELDTENSLYDLTNKDSYKSLYENPPNPPGPSLIKDSETGAIVIIKSSPKSLIKQFINFYCYPKHFFIWLAEGE